jgi:hypothetical protein
MKCSSLAVLVVCLSIAAIAADNPRIYIEDSQSWEVKGSVGGTDDALGGTTKGGARPQTAEIIKTFGERCHNVIVNNRLEKADYVVLLQHEGGKDLISRDNKVVVFNRDGDSILSRSTRSLGNAVTEACTAIMNDWTGHPAVDASVEQSGTPEVTGAQLKVTSSPAGADIEINGNFVGSTPSSIQLSPGQYKVAVTKRGFSSWERTVKVTGGNVNLVAELEQQP